MEAEIYMRWQPGYPSESKNSMINLLKGLCGLKQASRICQQTLYVALEELDDRVWCCSMQKRWYFCLIVYWGDDLCVVSDNEGFRTTPEECLKEYFITKCLGKLSHYVGIILKKEKRWFQYAQRPLQQTSTYPPGRSFQAQVPASFERPSKVDCPTTDEEKVEIDYPYINVTGSFCYYNLHKT
jgi:hypothetical protein